MEVISEKSLKNSIKEGLAKRRMQALFNYS